jgi:hypothetical protein
MTGFGVNGIDKNPILHDIHPAYRGFTAPMKTGLEQFRACFFR